MWGRHTEDNSFFFTVLSSVEIKIYDLTVPPNHYSLKGWWKRTEIGDGGVKGSTRLFRFEDEFCEKREGTFQDKSPLREDWGSTEKTLVEQELRNKTKSLHETRKL